MNLAAIRDQWGTRHFSRSPAKLVESLPLLAVDKALLGAIGLPRGPKAALKLFMRFEDVDVLHQPRQLRLVADAGLEKGKKFPRTGHAELDKWVDLSKFVVVGEAPGTFYPNRLVCVDGVRGGVWWVYPKLRDRRTDCDPINTSLASYLESWLAYKEFREEWTQLLRKYGRSDEVELEKADRPHARKMHRKFLSRLKKADPSNFEDSFWFHHAWDEAIMLDA
ncbi:SUKH-4 family immunity protein [Urbifossiella limnaea]|uniref:Uncharacterized protein n=1 Tax=Urbifossiella limnaea TaxID=2528023 RepID=A0A517Y3M3_9BACT|nr:SUKH-4 family immunity protein [Urbifossiella limnaea]QDU24347.1 hypothetical protein ETAA1_63610 [Urbifossiella limnaea]